MAEFSVTDHRRVLNTEEPPKPVSLIERLRAYKTCEQEPDACWSDSGPDCGAHPCDYYVDIIHEAADALELKHAYRADFDAQLDAARQEGRNEILKEIAALGWITTDGDCHFCLEHTPRTSSVHKPTCLLRRAIAASQTP